MCSVLKSPARIVGRTLTRRSIPKAGKREEITSKQQNKSRLRTKAKNKFRSEKCLRGEIRLWTNIAEPPEGGPCRSKNTKIIMPITCVGWKHEEYISVLLHCNERHRREEAKLLNCEWDLMSRYRK